MSGLAVAGCVAVAAILAGGPATASSDADYLVAGGPHQAERAEDGTTTLEVAVANLGNRELEVRLDNGAARCSDATGEPVLAPYTSGTVGFTMSCEPGRDPRRGAISSTTAGLSPERVVVEFTVEPASESDWAVLWWFLLMAPVAAASVLTAYGFWLRNPEGNRREQPTWGHGVETARGREGLKESWRRRHPLTRLPSLTQVWDFKNDWSSNVGLAAAVFTAVLANTDTLEGILGEDATGPLSVVTVAAAMSTALIGTGPLWLVICKRRYRDDPAATDHTVGGVLAASFVVLWASTGLIASVTALLDLWQADALAAVAGGMLLLYTAKSVPMTLAKGASRKQGAEPQPPHAPGHVEASGML